MRIFIDENNYITGYSCIEPDLNGLQYDWKNIPEEIRNANNQPLYKWDGTKPIYSPQPYTPEQTEQLRKAEVRAEIRELYSVEDEMKIHRQNINALMETDGTQTDEYIKYNNTVEKILLNSQKKDFQIGEKNVSK